MAKKLSFDNLPSAVARILDILASGDSEHTALPELAERIALLEKKIDYLQRTVTPDRPVMDMHEVCRALKLRPKAVSELARSGVLISRDQGRKTVYYEDSVVKCFMSGAAWKEAVESQPEPTRCDRPEVPAAEAVEPGNTDVRRRIGVNVAVEITNRNPAAIYQLIKNGKIPYHKDGRSVCFFEDELREWAQAHPARTYKKRNGNKE